MPSKAKVEIKLSSTGTYVPYTSSKNYLDIEMAKSLASYLKRQNSPGRLVASDGQILDQW